MLIPFISFIVISSNAVAGNTSIVEAKLHQIETKNIQNPTSKGLNQPKIELGILLEHVDNGLKIIDIIKGSTCDKAGFKIGDIITKFNGVQLTNSKQFLDLLRSIHSDSDEILNYIRTGQKIESSIAVNSTKLANGNFQIRFKNIKTNKPSDAVNAKVQNKQSEKTSDTLRNSGDLSKKDITKAVLENLRNNQSTNNKGINSTDKETGLNPSNEKDVQELLQKLKNSSNPNVAALMQNGKLPNNLPLDLKNTSTIKDAIGQLSNSGININEKTVQNYLAKNAKQLNLNDNNLDQAIPTTVMAMYKTNQAANPQNNNNNNKFNDPKAILFIRQIEALINEDEGIKAGQYRADGIVPLNKSGAPVDSNANSKVKDKISKKDFIPASALQSNLRDSIKYKAGDFIPVPELSFKNKNVEKIASNQTNGKDTASTNSGSEKEIKKPAFIPAIPKEDKELARLNGMLSDLKAQAEAKLRAEKLRAMKIEAADSILSAHAIEPIIKSEREIPQIPQIPINTTVITAHIYAVPVKQ